MGYTKQNFEDGKTLYAEQLNHIEQGVSDNADGLASLTGKVTTVEGKVDSAHAMASENESTIQTQEEKITELESEIDTLTSDVESLKSNSGGTSSGDSAAVSELAQMVCSTGTQAKTLVPGVCFFWDGNIIIADRPFTDMGFLVDPKYGSVPNSINGGSIHVGSFFNWASNGEVYPVFLIECYEEYAVFQAFGVDRATAQIGVWCFSFHEDDSVTIINHWRLY